MDYSLVIKNGKIVDGTGNPWFKAELALDGGSIAKIGYLVSDRAERVIDANGLVVCPGFIDTHSHSDGTLLMDFRVESTIRQGVTTQVIGNCGCGFAPINPARKEELVSYVRRLLPVDLESDWYTYREYMRSMAKAGCSTNIAPLLTHGALRIAVMGFENRVPTPGELGIMKLLASEGMEAGAFGLSTGLIYPPCIYAETPELVELCEVVAKYNGIFVIHMRGEGATLIPAVQEALEVANKANVRTHISHHKATGRRNWGKTEVTLGMIEKARAHGHEITFDQYPYTAGATVLSNLLPAWTYEGGLGKLLARLRDPETRHKIREEMEKREWEWEDVHVSVLKSEENKRFEGKNLREIKEIRGEPDEFTTLFNILLEEGGEARMVSFGQKEEEMNEVMRHPLHMVGSDGRSVTPHGALGMGKPHPRFYGTFPRILGKYVREEGVLRLEDAVRRMTSYPAQTFKMRNKGLLREDMDADVVVFDPETVLDRATYQKPHQYPAGVEYVIVNGEIVVEKGRHTGATPGKILSFCT
jgi:N-acyl-D-aspartate/D-glutamate deacylase